MMSTAFDRISCAEAKIYHSASLYLLTYLIQEVEGGYNPSLLHDVGVVSPLVHCGVLSESVETW